MIKRRLWKGIGLGVSALALAGCHTDMWRQPKLLGQEGNDFFARGQTTQPNVPGSVAWGPLRQDDAANTGRVNGKFVDALPVKLELAGESVDTSVDLEKVLRRGKERFEIFCTHCHGALGDGKGMIAQRGLTLRKPPASYHTDRLRKMPLGYFFDVMTNGHGVMYPFSYRVEPDERWAIASYIRVLQHSQNVNGGALTESQRDHMEQTQGGGAPEQQ